MSVVARKPRSSTFAENSPIEAGSKISNLPSSKDDREDNLQENN